MTQDGAVRRIRLTAAAVCLVLALAGGLMFGAAAAASVLGGGLLAAVSFAGVTVLTGALGSASGPGAAPVAAPGEPVTGAGSGQGADAGVPGTGPDADHAGARPQSAGVWTITKLVLRYALLGLLAYAMIARLRMHPLGLVVGVTSVPAAVSIEALRLLLKPKS